MADARPYHERYKPAPPPDYMRYLTAPFTGYWQRQGDLARQGLAMADEGAQRVQQGDPSGYLGMFLGPAGYLSSPITALLPTNEEIQNASDLPEWSKPGVAGIVGAAGMMLPGPKVKGLGRGMSALAADATDAERAALASRLEAEATQSGGAASAATRDQALANLTEQPVLQSPAMGRFDFSEPGTRGAREATIGDTTIDYGVGKDGLVEVTLIKTPKAKRGQGSARAAMQAMIDEADAAGLRLGLYADPMDKGVSKSRLVDFYESLGFKRNAGRNKDFSTRLEYLREPQK